jgi:hypothetical protein
MARLIKETIMARVGKNGVDCEACQGTRLRQQVSSSTNISKTVVCPCVSTDREKTAYQLIPTYKKKVDRIRAKYPSPHYPNW